MPGTVIYTLPSIVSARTTFTGTWGDPGAQPDVVIGGVPFFLAIDDQHTYSRKTLPWKRQQIDTSSEPGEQTLSQWWVRDQESWHRGAGINFYEPATDPYSRYRFTRSVGIDIWTVGQISLLKAMSNAVPASAGNTVGVTSAVRNGVNGVYYTTGGGLGWHDGTTATNFATTGVASATTPVVAGSKVLYGYAGGIAAATVGSETRPAFGPGGATAVTPYWVKSRIIATQDNKLYELTLAGGSLPTALYTHPDGNWVWTSVTETPDAILAAGRSNGYSAIYALTLTTTGSAGATPTLGPCAQVAEFPPGEEVYSIKCYLGSFLAIGSTRGVRIADLGSNGQMKYGPLTIETTAPVRALAARDSFVYAGIEADIDGVSGCARINLAEEITSQVDGIGYNYASTQRYAWAYDVATTGTTPVNSLAFLGNTASVALGVQGSGLWLTSTTRYVSSGYVKSGRIRHATAEQKIFPWLKLRSKVPSTSYVNVYTIDQSDQEVFGMTVDRNVDESVDISLTSLSEIPQSHVAIRLQLVASGDGLSTPVILHQQLKALPRPKIQRQISYPLRLQDREQDRNSTVVGYDGFAYERLAALEQMQEERVIVQVQDTTCGETFAAILADVDLERSTPPSRNLTNFGGLLTVSVIKL